MGRMVFHGIPRDGKQGLSFGAAARFDFSDTGRYELYITDYADDVCEGETQTAGRAWCEDASALLTAFAKMPKGGLGSESTLGEVQSAMANTIADMNEFFEWCHKTGVVFEEWPLFVERHQGE